MSAPHQRILGGSDSFHDACDCDRDNFARGAPRILKKMVSNRVKGVKKSSKMYYLHIGVSKNRGTPKSSILIGFSIINHPFWGTLIFGNTHMGKYAQACNISHLARPTDR